MFGECERELAHTRQITCRAFRRRDGLWEIEAVLVDEKAEEVPFRSRAPVRPGEAMHDMKIGFLIDRDYTIRDVQARMRAAPWPDCPASADRYSQLIGLRIGPGFRRKVQELVGGENGCTHLTDLITQVGNTYMQASWPERVAAQTRIDSNPRHWPDPGAVAFVGGCHAWRRGGNTLQREYPELADE
jgi:hypothetical protein